MSAIEVKKLVKRFNGQTVLHGIDLEVASGEVVAIIGPSGSGKTTLLRSINLLEEPDSGTIKVGGIEIDAAQPIGKQKERVRQLRQQVGFVFQSFNLFPHPSALDPELVGEVLNTIRSLAEEKRTMVIVTHEMSFARDVADRAIFMDQGRIVEQGPAKALFANPQQARTRQFLEKFLSQ